MLDLEGIKSLEAKLRSAQENQSSLDSRLKQIIDENENYRNQAPSEAVLNRKIETERGLRKEAELNLELMKEEFENQVQNQVRMQVLAKQKELDLMIEKAKQKAEDANEVYNELEEVRLQLTSAEQIIEEQQQYRQNSEQKQAQLRELLEDRTNTVDKMIKECTIECESRIREEKTRSQQIITDLEHQIKELQRETSLAKSSEERALRQSQRLEIQLQNERENSGVSRIENEVVSLRRKIESLERLRQDAINDSEELRSEQTKVRLDYERAMVAAKQEVEKSKEMVGNLQQELSKATDLRHDLEDTISQQELKISTLKSQEGLAMSASIAEQAKKIEQTRAEAQHWKSKYDVVIDEHRRSSAQLNDLYHKERLLNQKYRKEVGNMSSVYENKLRKMSNELKTAKARVR